jgi:hypothetical protein
MHALSTHHQQRRSPIKLRKEKIVPPHVRAFFYTREPIYPLRLRHLATMDPKYDL